MAAIIDQEGKLLTDKEEIKEMWRAYIVDLYSRADKPNKIEMEQEEEVGKDRGGNKSSEQVKGSGTGWNSSESAFGSVAR